jgi:demethylmenaquinone methyltransferase/2-methoxy-6-polyprenyl-1,4-benzoquinol methylase
MSNANHFGFKEVDPENKQSMVNDVFTSVASQYDLMNDLMSFGMHRLWKSDFINMMRMPQNGVHLDVAGGSGDIAMRSLEKFGRSHSILLDVNESMLSVGRREIESKFGSRASFITASAEDLPLQDNSVDVYTIAFGIRNVPQIDKAIAEAYRVLKPMGQFLCLEFSVGDASPNMQEIYDAYSFSVIPAMGMAVTGDSASYRYLIESIRKFPSKDNFSSMIIDGGFSQVSYIVILL